MSGRGYLARALARALNFDESAPDDTRAIEVRAAIDAYADLPHLGASEVVRVDGDVESDGPWSAFVDMNLEAGLDVLALVEIEAALVRHGRHVGHHDADVVLVSKIPALEIEDLIAAAPLDAVRGFAGDCDFSGDGDVRTFVHGVVADMLAEGSIERERVFEIFAPKPKPARRVIANPPADGSFFARAFDDVREDPHVEDPEIFGPPPAPAWGPGIWRGLGRAHVAKAAALKSGRRWGKTHLVEAERLRVESLLDLANRSRHEGDDASADLAMLLIARRS